MREASQDTTLEEVAAHKVSRSDVVSLTVSLREGATYDALRSFLPGLTAAGLVGAYQLLTARRDEAMSAWTSLTAKPTYTGIMKNAETAMLLLPAPVGRILRHIQEELPEHEAADLTHSLTGRIKEDTKYAREVEHELASSHHSDKRKLRIGEELYNPVRECLWGGPYYLPRRVTDLSPLRVNLLMGEELRAGL